MKTKTIHNGFCLHCGKESTKPFCNRQCYREYVKGNFSQKDYEKRQRKLLSDRIVKRNIYIASKGSIKYDQMTPEMIKEKRTSIIVYRERREEIRANPPVSRDVRCVVCENKIITTHSTKSTCSKECGKEKARRDSFNVNKDKKVLKARSCKECGKVFTPEYGNKRRDFCSSKCLDRYQDRTKCRNGRERAKKYGCDYEYVNPLKVFMRDGWICQLCNKRLKNKDRGKLINLAPELDHIIPISKGGAHSYKNTQCACRKCNNVKGDKERGQLRMFG